MTSGGSGRDLIDGRFALLERLGGGGQSYQTYLQVVEELASAWLAVGLGVSVHTLTCFPLATAGTPEQQELWLPGMLGGEQLGAYCLSEPASGSDAAGTAWRAKPAAWLRDRGMTADWRLHALGSSLLRPTT